METSLSNCTLSSYPYTDQPSSSAQNAENQELVRASSSALSDMMKSPPSFFSTCDLLWHVAEYLPPLSIVACAHTSSKWYETFKIVPLFLSYSEKRLVPSIDGETSEERNESLKLQKMYLDRLTLVGRSLTFLSEMDKKALQEELRGLKIASPSCDSKKVEERRNEIAHCLENSMASLQSLKTSVKQQREAEKAKTLFFSLFATENRDNGYSNYRSIPEVTAEAATQLVMKSFMGEVDHHLPYFCRQEGEGEAVLLFYQQKGRVHNIWVTTNSVGDLHTICNFIPIKMTPNRKAKIFLCNHDLWPLNGGEETLYFVKEGSPLKPFFALRELVSRIYC